MPFRQFPGYPFKPGDPIPAELVNNLIAAIRAVTPMPGTTLVDTAGGYIPLGDGSGSSGDRFAISPVGGIAPGATEECVYYSDTLARYVASGTAPVTNPYVDAIPEGKQIRVDSRGWAVVWTCLDATTEEPPVE